MQALSRLSETSTHLERVWAYVTLGASGIITEETSPIVGGLAAHNGHLRFALVVAALTLGTWAADLILYSIGWWRGTWVRDRWPKLRSAITRALSFVGRHPWRCSLAVRFAYGLRFTLPVACGAARIPIPVYTIGSAISAFVWSFTFTAAGWWIARTTRALGGHPRHYELYFTIAVLVAGVIVFIVSRKRHVAEKTVEVLEAD